MRTPVAMKTFWPMLQPLPMALFFMTWLKCQIRVPSPIVQGSST